jgi:adenylylsulfate kinase
MRPAFAVWLTGLPASGKSTIARALVAELAARGIKVAVLESDVLRRLFTPRTSYDEAEREAFYQGMVYIGALLVGHGVPVVFDATANRRKYRAGAPAAIERFIEVYVECPLDVCVARDPKGIYRKARSGEASTVPGLQAPYEAPNNPDVVVSGHTDLPQAAAHRIVCALEDRGYINRGAD